MLVEYGKQTDLQNRREDRANTTLPVIFKPHSPQSSHSFENQFISLYVPYVSYVVCTKRLVVRANTLPEVPFFQKSVSQNCVFVSLQN